MVSYEEDFSRRSLRKYFITILISMVMLVVLCIVVSSVVFIHDTSNIDICRAMRVNGDRCLVVSEEYSEDARVLEDNGINLSSGETSLVEDSVLKYKGSEIDYEAVNYFGREILQFEGIDKDVLNLAECKLKEILEG